MEKNGQTKGNDVPNYWETDPQEVSVSKQYHLFIDTLYRKLILNLNSWTFQYWLFFYGVIPFILLTIAILSAVLPRDIFLEFFVQNQTHFISVSTYVSNFSHNEILHLSSNLLFYLLSVTTIFIFEENKKRLIICSTIFFTFVPILGSYLTQQVWEIVHTVNGHNLGFSAIALAFFGYALYIAFKWLYATVLISTTLKSSETKIRTSIIQHFSVKKNSKYELIQDIGFIIEFLLFALMMNITIKFGFDAGQYVGIKGTMSNGISHFQGFVLGLISPIIFSIFIEKTERIFDLVFLLLLFIGIWNYYSQYLAPSLHL